MSGRASDLPCALMLTIVARAAGAGSSVWADAVTALKATIAAKAAHFQLICMCSSVRRDNARRAAEPAPAQMREERSIRQKVSGGLLRRPPDQVSQFA